MPTKFGISFGVTFMSQGGALLHVYTDGSVLLTHGGMEMGQGLHTKMVQVCIGYTAVPGAHKETDLLTPNINRIADI